ncbi:hypothetical protein ASPZODRAFT_134570 [Penicilliopsis zonata CBS 506.65]|uniref:WW domain-containing oxidoreductase n=1 Tax=Penicilliopsis zonata CBS 506.65 TaxID=1073090 RepID=A0A1L9SDE8_9EURO|nr:hypothetical protein ASPZODRAFT_134570 [Penicilliopsis zonata CBS 506.65]OJJ45162.1 hypothetical protein ASPZODRAFT_134570 [Penicilliopsis zonata CBS 506.65]
MSQYAAVYANPQGPGDARPTALQIVKDSQMEGQLKGKTVVITGVSSGLGVETARALAATGATLFLTARDLVKAKTALGDFLQPDRMHLVEMDQSSLKSVRNAAKSILAKTNTVNILIGNAGVMAVPTLELTEDGYESQFATNHLAHFLFFHLLKDALLAGSTPAFQSRVVMLSASGHRVCGLNPSENYHFTQGGYIPWVAYAQSKTANIYMANEIDRRYGPQGIHATSVHPGIVATQIARHLPAELVAAMIQDATLVRASQTPEQGAATTVYAAISRDWEGRGGRYLCSCSETERGPDDGVPTSSTYVTHTYSPEDEERLWQDSLKMVSSREE